MAFIKKHILFGDHSEWGWSAEKKRSKQKFKVRLKFRGSTLISAHRLWHEEHIGPTFMGAQ